MKKNGSTIFFFLSFVALSFLTCSRDKLNNADVADSPPPFISAVDISSFPKIQLSNPIFYNQNGVSEDFLSILKSHGINTIRLRLWVNPNSENSGLDEVKSFSNTLKSMGFKIYISLHYSDTWADPGHQSTPDAWQNIPFASLKDSVYQYTTKVMQQLSPDVVQIGNEINNGFLFPEGNLHQNSSQFLDLLNEGIHAVRAHSADTQIMLHYAGHEGSSTFFNLVKNLDYDIIGLSYYPIWHGKSLITLKQQLIHLESFFSKDIMIAETAYPFTLNWNDWTNNIVGLENQLILPEYPATPNGQKDFLSDLKLIVTDLDRGIGLSYWGAELIAWNGMQSTEGSPWENQTLFDFDNKILPAAKVFEN